MAFGTASLIEHAAHLGFDEILFPEAGGAVGAGPGRIAKDSALCFVLSGHMQEPDPGAVDPSNALRVLLIEDNEDDAALIESCLRVTAAVVACERVKSAEELRLALTRLFDIVIADYMLPSFTGLDALPIIAAHDPHLPCIIVSGSAGEERAIQALKAGAHDYILKTNLDRLPLAVRRGLDDARARRERAAALRQVGRSEQRFRTMFEKSAAGMAEADESERFVAVNQRLCEMLGYTAEELIGREIISITHPDDIAMTDDRHRRLAGGDSSLSLLDKRYIRKDGSVFWATTDVSIVMDPDTGQKRFFGMILDIDARKRAEEALRASESKYRLILEQSGDAIFVSDRDHRYVEVNSRASELTGFSRDELLAMTIPELIPREDLVSNPLRVPQLRPGTSFLIERRLNTKSGPPVDVEISATGLSDGHALASVREITQRKRAEEKLRISERRFQMVVHATSDTVYDLDLATGSMWRSATFSSTFGYDDSDTSLEWFKSKVHPDDLDRTLRLLQEAIDGPGELWSAEYRLRKRNGDYAYIVDRGSIMRDAAGVANRVIGTMMDLTAHKKAEESLRLSEERLRAMVENGLDVISIVDSTGTVLYKSPSERTVFGYDPEKLIGTSAFDRVHSEDKARIQEIFYEALAVPGSTRRAEYRYLHKNGTWRDVEAIGSNLLARPAVRGIVITIRDITERKRIQEQLQQSERLSGLGRLAATIAHEFNNVLMGIQPFSELIRRVAPDDSRLVNAAEQISRSIARGKRITQEILRFTRPAQLTMSMLNIATWLGDMTSELRTLLGPAFDLVMEVPDHDLTMFADAGQMTQVLTNIALNARDAMSGGGTLRISVERQSGNMIYPFGVLPNGGEYVHISISDTGTGIPREVMDRIWEPLFTTKKSGTGLGLAVARQVIDRHSGHIFVESTPGEGTTFHMFLPRREQLVSRWAPTVASRPFEGRRVLIVDDEPAVAGGIAMLLEMVGHQARCAGSGAEAVSAVVEFDPDVVILDVGLPDVDGFTLCRTLLAQNPSLPIIFSTAHGDRSALASLPEDAAVDFLQKPYELEGLTAALNRVLAMTG